MQDAIDLELDLLAALEFKLEVNQPWPIILYFSAKLAERGKSDAAQKLFDAACDTLSSWQWTDAVIVYPFPLLAIAAVAQAAEVCGVESSFSEIAASEFGAETIKVFESLPARVKSVISRHPRPSQESIEALAERCNQSRSSKLLPKRRRRSP